MSNKAKNPKKKSFRWLNLLAVFIMFFFCLRIGGQVKQYFALQKDVDYYQEQLDSAEADYTAQLSKEDLLNNDAYLERLAREKLGMVKEGEEVVSVLNVNLPDVLTTSDGGNSTSKGETNKE